MVTFLNKESLTTKLTLIIIGLTAGSGLLIPGTYAAFHPVTSGEIADNTIQSVDIENSEIRTEDIGAGQVRTGDIADGTIRYADLSRSFVAVEHRDDCNCGGGGWDPDGTNPEEIIVDDRITPNSVVSVTIPNVHPIVCGTDVLFSGSVNVVCNSNIPENTEVNYAIFNPQ
jgi:hypothetical protein